MHLLIICTYLLLYNKMPKQCCIENCKLLADDPGCNGLTFHKVPADPTRKLQWQGSINNYFKNNLVLGQYSYVCSLHFEEKCYNKNGMGQRSTLTKTAVPTVFENYYKTENSSHITSLTGIDEHVDDESHTVQNISISQGDSFDEIESHEVISKKLCQETLVENAGSSFEMVEPSEGLDGQKSSSTSSNLDEQPMFPEYNMNTVQSNSSQISAQIFKKSIANINLDSIDLNNKPLVLQLLKNAQREVQELRKSNRSKSSKLYRARQRVKNFTNLLSHLKTRGFISDKQLEALDGSVPEEAQAIFERLLETRKRKRKFPRILRKFATTLHFFSPKAYNYLRTVFLKSLPHSLTISRWYRKIECNSGINKASLEVLKDKVREVKKSNGGKPVLCNLVMDEMDIKEKIEIISDREFGYIDRGTNVNAVPTPAATNVFVTMIVCENGKFKIPISYHFIVGLSGHEKAKIVNENLIAVHDAGITVTSITFDGLQANFAMYTALGARTRISSNESTKPFFPHPVTKEDIYIIFDGCHALKLIRNTLASGNDMYDSQGNFISWTFIENLIDFQTEHQLNAGNKLTEEHKRWEDNKMNVRIAAQTCSRSTSNSLLYMRDELKLPQFSNVEGTAKFCLTIDSAFDILNSRHLYSQDELKEGISKKNFEKIKLHVEEIILYLKGLRFTNGQLVVDSTKKTGFEGMIISLKNVMNIYQKYFEPEDLYLLTYKVLQDHIEIFFSAIRSRGGNSNNPTCHQFSTAFKQLLTHADIKASDKANCVVLDETELLRIPEDTWKSLNQSVTRLIQTKVDAGLNDHEIDFESPDFYGSGFNKKYIDDVVGYIAGSIVRKILVRTKCFSCPLVLTDESSHSALLEKKNRGGLIKPSLDVFRTCQLLEHTFRTKYQSRRGILREMILYMSAMIPQQLLLIEHSDNPKEHRAELIKTIIYRYFLIRSKKFESVKQQKKKRVRRKFHKLILHCHD